MPAALFNWLIRRESGVLLHPTALPSSQGIGVLGQAARRFVDFLSAAGISYWQVLPLGPTGYGDSPYQSFSAFAGNPYLIDLEALVVDGLLEPGDLASLRSLPEDHVAFGDLYDRKWPVLRQAWRRFADSGRSHVRDYGSFEHFRSREASWLDPFATFMALKDRFDGSSWLNWPTAYRDPQSAREQPDFPEILEAARAHAFYQYLFASQWKEMRAYAAARNVQIIGDVPIFVSLDSADVWSNRHLFLLQPDGQPEVVAGVPPDYFSPKGQLWGNPLYHWPILREQGYAWWLDRLDRSFALCDVLRLDHFRGFHAYWEVPAEAGDARAGRWQAGPRLEFFQALREAMPQARMIAEDLGDIDDKVRQFCAAVGFPGMAITQFAFDLNAQNLYLPHNLVPNQVVYPGVHDNDTSRGWYESASPHVQDQVRRYFRISGHDLPWDFIRAAYQAVSRLAIIPAQDLLALGSEARFNRPGEAAGNWQWRFSQAQLDGLFIHARYLQGLGELYGRLPVRAPAVEQALSQAS